MELLRHDLPALQRQGITWLPQQSTIRNGFDTPTATQPKPQSAIVTRTHTLPAGGTVTDTLAVNLARGQWAVQATLRVDEADNPGLFSHSLAQAWTQERSLTLRPATALSVWNATWRFSEPLVYPAARTGTGHGPRPARAL
ncbi:MAG: hypothetical protein ACE5IG_07335 [Dehalococcoidia bacterium]